MYSNRNWYFNNYHLCIYNRQNDHEEKSIKSFHFNPHRLENQHLQKQGNSPPYPLFGNPFWLLESRWFSFIIAGFSPLNTKPVLSSNNKSFSIMLEALLIPHFQRFYHYLLIVGISWSLKSLPHCQRATSFPCQGHFRSPGLLPPVPFLLPESLNPTKSHIWNSHWPYPIWITAKQVFPPNTWHRLELSFKKASQVAWTSLPLLTISLHPHLSTICMEANKFYVGFFL